MTRQTVLGDSCAEGYLRAFQSLGKKLRELNSDLQVLTTMDSLKAPRDSRPPIRADRKGLGTSVLSHWTIQTLVSSKTVTLPCSALPVTLNAGDPNLGLPSFRN